MLVGFLCDQNDFGFNVSERISIQYQTNISTQK